MMRTSIQRLVGASASRPARPISTSSVVLAKIRRPDGSTVRPGSNETSTSLPPRVPNESGSGSAGQQRSPAERPPSPSPPPPAPASASSCTPTPTSSRTNPLQAAPTETEAEVDEPLNLADLPSLNNLETVTETARIERQKRDGAAGADADADRSGSGPKRTTGAGRKQYVSSIERQRRMWLRYGLLGLGAGGIGYALYQGASGPSVCPFSRSWILLHLVREEAIILPWRLSGTSPDADSMCRTQKV